MRITALFATLVMAMAAHGCGSSSSCKTNCADGGAGHGGTTGAGGRGGAGGDTAGTGGRAGTGGAATGTAGTGGGAGTASGGTGGAAGGRGGNEDGGHGGTGAAGGQMGGSSGGVGDGGRGGSGGTVGAGGGGGTGGAGGRGGGTAGAGGTGGTAGAGGSAGSGGTGGSAACSEPASCEGYDNSPDANLVATITCLSPSSTAANAGFTLAIFGHHLATAAGSNAIVIIGNGLALNGVPVSACHLDVTVPASGVASPGQLPVVVSPGGRVQDSAPVTLTVR